ncbi:MAG: hypothetical protein SFU91_06800 [Chloroherpetonaceae bacterium]|nr:hypothetical protein [Chloroherpetonaceae bacterium]
MKFAFSLFLLFFFFLQVDAQTPITKPEAKTICFYLKPISEDSLLIRIVQSGMVENEKMSRNLLITMPSRSELYIDYYNLPPRDKPKNDAIRLEDVYQHIGAHFSTFSKDKLNTIVGYRNLIEVIRSQSTTLFKSIKLTSFGIPDLVYVFNFELALENDALLRDPNTPESVALYNFMTKQWIAETAQPDYTRKLRSAKFEGFIQQSFISGLTKVSDNAKLSSSDQKLIETANLRALYALGGVGLLLIFCLFLLFNAGINIRKLKKTLERVEGKLRVMDNKLEKPFYQSTEVESKRDFKINKSIDDLLIRIRKLELGSNYQPFDSQSINFINPLAAKIAELNTRYKLEWSKPSAFESADISMKLAFYLDEFTSLLSELEAGVSPKSFVPQVVFQHIDRIDALFQTDIDSTLNTPEQVLRYIKELCEILAIRQIEIIPRNTAFNNEIHEKAGAMLKTAFAPNTIIKVLQRGLVHENYIRKSKVVKAE